MRFCKLNVSLLDKNLEPKLFSFQFLFHFITKHFDRRTNYEDGGLHFINVVT